ncbi:formyltransferase family protein [Streptomyces sp. NPDC001339]|uniref:formyltransferase family protein n=1 Tax=Streptomyces sp. NPDC001339 TaxID=3364563 RepID=UPI00367CE0AA
MTVVLFAYHDVGCRTVEVLTELGIEIACVYTHHDDPGENTWFGSVAGTAASLGIPVRHADPRTAGEREHIRALAPRALFSAYWRHLLPDEVLGLAPVAVNVHGSLLPRYRGRAPVNWQILHGEREGGVSLHHMVREPDAGDLVDQESFPIGPDDTPTDIYRKLLPATEAVLRRNAWPVIEGRAPRWPQLASKATVFGRRRPADGLIDFRHAAEDIRNLIRAVTDPYPGAFCHMGPHQLTIWRAGHPSSEPPPRPGRPGEIHIEPAGVFVLCGDGRRLCLDEVELDGRRGTPRDFPHVLRHEAVLGRVRAGR